MLVIEGGGGGGGGGGDAATGALVAENSIVRISDPEPRFHGRRRNRAPSATTPAPARSPWSATLHVPRSPFIILVGHSLYLTLLSARRLLDLQVRQEFVLHSLRPRRCCRGEILRQRRVVL